MGSVGANRTIITPEIAKSYINEINKTSLSYKGMDADYGYRVAEISFDDDIANGNGVDRVVSKLEDMGYDVDTGVSGLYLVEVENKADYSLFSKRFQTAKKSVRDELKKIK